jgi:hypothetical protein
LTVEVVVMVEVVVAGGVVVDVAKLFEEGVDGRRVVSPGGIMVP